MRNRLSRVLVDACLADPKRIVLSGDHGYALFDELRKRSARSFINVGVMEQAMVGMAAGLAKSGHRPIVYGLSAFVPIRVLEQIKIDVCHVGYPVIFLGDGAGLVYSTLGASHQCGEDIAALRTLPGLTIYSPADEFELAVCFSEALNAKGPVYIRIGKSDRPAVVRGELLDSRPRRLRAGASDRPIVITSGSMTAIGHVVANENDLQHIGVLRLKPVHPELVEMVRGATRLIVVDEHSRYGGLASTIADALLEAGRPVPPMKVLCLKDRFVHSCGSYQHALSEHGLDDATVMQEAAAFLGGGA